MKRFADHRRAQQASESDSRADKIIRDAVRLVASGHPDQAVAALGRSKLNTDPIRNARGVCLMRMGRMEEALRLFRSLVLAPGCTWMKPDLPIIYGTNFCTVLLLDGHPAGCRTGLNEIAREDHPSVIRLRQALDGWQRSLKGWAWLTWKLGAEPDVPVLLDFAPGEFFESQPAPENRPPQQHPLDRAA